MTDLSSETIECPVCTERYDEKIHIPKRLHCPHTICVMCARRLTTKRNRIKCPLCGHEQSCSRADKLATDLASLQTSRVMDLLVCADCRTVMDNIRTCPLCETRSCDKCIMYHKTSDHCDVMNNIRRITQIVDDSKVHEAKKIKRKIQPKVRNMPRTKSDIETVFADIMKQVGESKKEVLREVASLEIMGRAAEAILSCGKTIEQVKTDLCKDKADMASLKVKLARTLSLVEVSMKADIDKVNLKMNVTPVLHAIAELGIGLFNKNVGGESKKQIRGIKNEPKKPVVTSTYCEDDADYSEIGPTQYWWRGANPRKILSGIWWSYILHITRFPNTDNLCILSSQHYGSASITIVNLEEAKRVKDFSIRGKVMVNGVATISEDQVAVTMKGLCLVRIYDTAAQLIREFGSQGREGQQFYEPAGICHKNGFLYIADQGNNRISVWMVDGRFSTHYKHKSLKSPYDVAINDMDDLAVLCYDANRVVLFDASGDYKTVVAPPDEYLPGDPKICFDIWNNLVVAGTEEKYDNPKVLVDIFNDKHEYVTRLETGIGAEDDGDVCGVCCAKNGELVVAAGYGRINAIYLF